MLQKAETVKTTTYGRNINILAIVEWRSIQKDEEY